MKEEQKIWIQGNPKRGKEVITKLESLGGKNASDDGTGEECIYYILPNGYISWAGDNTSMTTVIKDNYTEYKLPELPEKYHFKPFDKILVRFYNNRWHAALYSFEDENWFYVIGGTGFSKKYLQIIPFNKDTEHLLGTKDEYNI